MSFSQPAAPGSGDRFENADHKGRLLLIYPKAFQTGFPTTKGLSDVADCDVIVVDSVGPNGQPLAFFGIRFFGNLARSVSRDLGGQVLGRLNQITMPNGNTPWVLENYTPQDEQLATAVDAAYRAGQIQPPPQNPMNQQAPATAPGATQYAAAPAAPPAGQQSWQPPAPAATPPPQQQWSPPPPPPAPVQQQWQPPAAPAPTPAPQAAPAAPPAAPIDPNLLAYLASKGLNGPFPDQATAEAVANSIQ